MVGKHANSGTTSENEICVRHRPENTWKLACPSFKVTGRHCNSDAPDGPETNFRSEHTLDGTNGWIVNFYYGIAAKPSFYASMASASATVDAATAASMISGYRGNNSPGAWASNAPLR